MVGIRESSVHAHKDSPPDLDLVFSILNCPSLRLLEGRLDGRPLSTLEYIYYERNTREGHGHSVGLLQDGGSISYFFEYWLVAIYILFRNIEVPHAVLNS